MTLNNLYLYVKANECEDVLKYGIKLSEYCNRVFKLANTEKKGITAYLAPKDSKKYFDKNYTCLRISTTGLKIYVINDIFSTLDSVYDKHTIIKLENYKLGDFEDPIAIICTSILPENIYTYNEIIDTPLIVSNSKDYFYEKAVQDMIENNYFSNYELYKAMLILGEKKGIFEQVFENNTNKIYMNKLNKKIYTNISKF